MPLLDAKGVIVYSGFPADVLVKFRLNSIIAQLILWTTIALAFAPMADKLLTPLARTARPRADHPAPVST